MVTSILLITNITPNDTSILQLHVINSIKKLTDVCIYILCFIKRIIYYFVDIAFVKNDRTWFVCNDTIVQSKAERYLDDPSVTVRRIHFLKTSKTVKSSFFVIFTPIKNVTMKFLLLSNVVQ